MDSTPPQSNARTFFAKSGVQAGEQLGQNQSPGTTFVVTFLDIQATGGGGTSALLLGWQRGTDPPVAVHSGNVGQAALDRFPLTCVIALDFEDSIVCMASEGAFDCYAAGYYTPNLYG